MAPPNPQSPPGSGEPQGPNNGDAHPRFNPGLFDEPQGLETEATSIFGPYRSVGEDGDHPLVDDVHGNTDDDRSDIDFGHRVPLPPDSTFVIPWGSAYEKERAGGKSPTDLGRSTSSGAGTKQPSTDQPPLPPPGYRPPERPPILHDDSFRPGSVSSNQRSGGADEARTPSGRTGRILQGDEPNGDDKPWPEAWGGTVAGSDENDDSGPFKPHDSRLNWDPIEETDPTIRLAEPLNRDDIPVPSSGAPNPTETGTSAGTSPRRPASPSPTPAPSSGPRPTAPAPSVGGGGSRSGGGPAPTGGSGGGRGSGGPSVPTGGSGEAGSGPDDGSDGSEPAVVIPSGGGAPTPGAATATQNRPAQTGRRGRFTGRRTGAELVDPEAVRKAEEARTEALRIRTEERRKQRKIAKDERKEVRNDKIEQLQEKYQHRLDKKAKRDQRDIDKKNYLKSPEAIAAAKFRSEQWKQRRERVKTTYKAGRTHTKGARGWTPPVIPGTARFFATQAKDARTTIFKDKEASKIYYRSLLFVSRTLAYAIEKVSNQVEKHPKSAVVIGVGAYVLNKTGIGFPGWDGIPGVDLKDHLPDWDWLPDFMEGHSPSGSNHGAKEMLNAQDLNLPPAKPATAVSNPLGLTMPPLNGQPSPGGITSEVFVNAQNASTMSEVGQTFVNIGRQIVNEFGDTGRQAWDWLTQHDYIQRDPVHGGYVISGLGDHKGSIPSDVYHRIQELLSGADDELSELYNNARN